MRPESYLVGIAQCFNVPMEILVNCVIHPLGIDQHGFNWRIHIESAVWETRIREDEGVRVLSLNMDVEGRKTGVGYTATDMPIDGLGGSFCTARIRVFFKNAEESMDKEFL